MEPWPPGHHSYNEMADCCAKAHLDQPVADDVTRQIASLVRTRDCLYEVESEYQDGAWVLADRRCFRLARQCMRRWVRRQLLSNVNTLRYDAKLADGKKYNYGESGYCTEVVKGFGTGKKVAPGVTCEHMRDDARRVGFVMGRRAGDSGLPHERGHARLLSQFEGDDDGSEIDDEEERCLYPVGSCSLRHSAITDLDVRDVSRGCPMAHARGVADGWGDRLDRCHPVSV